MNLPSTSGRRQSGITLIEIIVVIGLIALLAAFSMFASLDFYRSFMFRKETATVISLLERARNLAMNNLNEKNHGLHFESGRYVLFQGLKFDQNDPANEQVEANLAITISSPALPFDVIFSPLSGDTPQQTITLKSSNGKSAQILINQQGAIDW